MVRFNTPLRRAKFSKRRSRREALQVTRLVGVEIGYCLLPYIQG
jgi:hypothetical protein